MFAVDGHDNDIEFFDERDDVRRCESCGLLLCKWDESLPSNRLPNRLTLDISASYDGVDVVSRKFRELYDANGMKGLRFIEIERNAYAIRAERVVPFDWEAGGTRFENRCAACGQYESIVGATPVRVKAKTTLSGLEFARTDLECTGDCEETGC